MEPRSRVRRSGWSAPIVALAVAMLVAAGCSAAPERADGASFTFGVQAAVNSLDPAQLHDGQQGYVWSAVYDTLLYSDNDAVLRPNAAESWAYSADARTLTLTLRGGMTFSNGDPVTAGAVRTTLERTRVTPGPQKGNLAQVTSVEAPDERTVVLHLQHPDPNLLYALSGATGVIGHPGTIDDPSVDLNPIGSGPYVLNREATIAGSRYVLQRRADYWNVAAYPFATMTIRVLPDRTALFNALVSSEVDAGTVEGNRVRAAESADLSVKLVQGVTTAEIVLADRAGKVVPALADVRVRRAINMAFDRQKIVDRILGGFGTPTTQVFGLKGPAYVPQLDDRYRYDPPAARRLLAEAGYPNGFSVAMPSNLPSQTFEPTITQALADIGITVTWEPVPAQNASATTDRGMYVNMAGTAPPPRTAVVKLSSIGSQNPFGSRTPELDGLLRAVEDETDPDRAAAGYRDINAYIVENAWFAPLFSISTNWVTRKGIEYLGTGANPAPTIRTFGISRT